MRVGSLFSGIGGLDHGLANAGFEHVFLCESDPWRRDVLRARFPGVPVYDDVRDVERHPSMDDSLSRRRSPDIVAGGERSNGTVDLLCGGFPCQDVSVAGQRRGLAGNRSGLFYEFARIADALRPGWLLVENVPGLLSSNGGRDFGSVVGTLADIGYGLAWRILDSRYFGVPQRRRRVYILGALADGDPRAAAERAGQILAVGSRCDRHPPTRGEAREGAAVASLSGLGTGGPDDNDGQAGRIVSYALNGKLGHRDDGESETFIASTLKSQAGKGGSGIGPEHTFVTAFHQTQDPIHGDNLTPALGETSIGMGVYQGASVRRLMPVECERLQALPDGWTDLGGTADSRRYAALGDAVTASVGEWIGRRIMTSSGTAQGRHPEMGVDTHVGLTAYPRPSVQVVPE